MCPLCRLLVAKNHNFGKFWPFWGLLYRPPFTDEGQIWWATADPWYTSTCEISSRSEMRYKLCKFGENHARDTSLRGVYILHFGQIWVKISILGVLHPCCCTDGGWNLAWRPLLHAKFHPHRCNVSPLRGKKPQNRPLSKLNTGRLALRAMLPIINSMSPRNNTGKKRQKVLVLRENRNR